MLFVKSDAHGRSAQASWDAAHRFPGGGFPRREKEKRIVRAKLYLSLKHFTSKRKTCYTNFSSFEMFHILKLRLVPTVSLFLFLQKHPESGSKIYPDFGT